MITRFNRASSHLINKMDVNHLESLPPSDRVRQLQTSAVEVTLSIRFAILFNVGATSLYSFFDSHFFLQTFLRLSFELNLSRQSAADKETLAALTSRYDEQNEEIRKL